MTTSLQLPSLVAGRDLADEYADQLGDVAEETVTVDARSLTSGTSSFAAQLVRRILLEGHAHRLVVVGAPARFVHHLREASAADQVSAGLETVDTMQLADAS
ncbi:hypothetical protein SAMN05443575_1452 [Jatrophihabitans endophyticus]|uniref:STAS domain-containing protein n=1 Tax=Jatrophihabitans endophyticus TaxID=1206085 RepID=A0A1M5HAN6_9ACTN|nr:hypothetical protein [Jatrophihabitans endophyticus]SHG12996.1 hypothetical protein SAMN05443575_1452 [Jatrophihabitans endophyticus]